MGVGGAATTAKSCVVKEQQTNIEVRGLLRVSVDLQVETTRRVDFLNLTEEVEGAVARSGIGEGTANVFILHTTAAIALTEWQNALMKDIETWLERAVPKNLPWEHNNPEKSDCDRSNSDSHLRSLLLGPSVTLPIREHKLLRGSWQSIALLEFDGPRQRKIVIQLWGA